MNSVVGGRPAGGGVRASALIKRYWPWLLAAAFLGGILGYSASFLLPPQWEALGLVRVGKVGQAGQDSQPIEPAPEVAQRLKLKTFQLSVAVLVSPNAPASSPSNSLFMSSLKVRAIPASDLVEVRVRSYSATGARDYVKGIASVLGNTQQTILRESLGRLKEQHLSVSANIEQARAHRDEIAEKALCRPAASAPGEFMQHVIASNIVIQRDDELRKLEAAKFAIEEAMSLTRTYPTSLVDDVSVSDSPVAPRRLGPAVAGGLLALLAVALLLVRRLLRGEAGHCGEGGAES